jgi:undecaprenyl-diphosphatase
MSLILQENYLIFLDINRYAGDWPWLDGLMIFLANILIFFWPLFLLALWGLPRPWRTRPLGEEEASILQECRATVLWAPLACVLAYGFNLAFEQVIFEPRPFVTHHVHLLVSHVADDSFPSDHVAVSFAIVGMILFTIPWLLMSVVKKQRGCTGWQALLDMLMRRPLVFMGIALLFGCSIAVARVFVGVHYPGDVIVGAFDGCCAAACITLIRRFFFVRPTEAVLRFIERMRLA